MKIVSVASEGMPFVKTGGLADVIGTLPAEIHALGHPVLTFLPRYKSIDLKKWNLELVIPELSVPVGSEKEIGRVYAYNHKNGLQFYFIDHAEYYSRDELYGTPLGDYPDNDRRFIFFQRAVLEALRVLNIHPDVIHCHDWQTGLIPVYLRILYSGEPLFRKTKTVYTIHNLAYQGNFPPDSLPLTGLGWETFRLERLEFYGKVSFLKGGIVYSDAITTVSESYAQQIQAKEFGCGLEGVLQRRRDRLFGIVNGIDYEEWNPETDPHLAANYNLKTIQKKEINKAALQKENELKVDPALPIYGLVSRLVDQKGIDILIPALIKMAEWDIQFVLLGTGEEKYHQIFREMAKKNKGRFGIRILFDSKMAKRIYGGCDFMLIPSYYEPCGLAQMIACRYATIPVVRATGGLRDTVQEFDPETQEGNGFLFQDYTSEALLEAVQRSMKIYQEKRNWKILVRNAMASDFSWAASAKKYVKLFEELEHRKVDSFGKF